MSAKRLLNVRLMLAVLVVALLILLPGLTPENRNIQSLAFLTFLYVCLSSAWNVLGGFGGQTSFGHAAFFGIGAYTTAILVGKGWPAAATVPLAGVLAVIYSVLWGYPTFRLRGPYFAIATIGVGEATRLLMLNWESLTGGASGQVLSLPADVQSYQNNFYFIGLFFMVVVLATCTWIRYSKFGLGLFAVNMDPDAAETLGVNTTRIKLLALGFSAFVVSIAGSIYAQYFFFIDPNTVFGFNMSIAMILMPTIGGIGTLSGPVLGAIVFEIVQDRILTGSFVAFGYKIALSQVNLLVYGGLLVIIMLFEPKGISGIAQNIWRSLYRRTKRAPVQSLPMRRAP